MVPLTESAAINVNNSSCSINSTTAKLSVVPDTDIAMPPYQVVFEFSGVSVSRVTCE